MCVEMGKREERQQTRGDGGGLSRAFPMPDEEEEELGLHLGGNPAFGGGPRGQGGVHWGPLRLGGETLVG